MKVHDELSKIPVGMIESILANPVYAGMGPYPAVVQEETWVAAVVQFISEEGPEKYVRLMLSALRVSLDGSVFPGADVIGECDHCSKLKELYERTPMQPRDYWLMTEIFVALHGGDVCKES